MAGNVVRIAILANAQNAVNGFRNVQREADVTRTRLDRIKGGLTSMAAPAAMVLGGLAIGAFKAGQKAAELGDAIDANRIIMGGATSAVQKFADSAAKNFGISKQVVIDAANAIGNIGSKAGLAGSDLAKFTTDAVGRAGDMASMFGGTAKEAVDAMGSAMRGEFEPIRRYGVLIDDAGLKAQAMKMGLIDNVKQGLTPSQKALATHKMILEQTAKAQGNFADTADSAKNKQERLKAELANVQAELGAKLLPAMSAVAGALSGMLGWVDKNRGAATALVIAVGGLAAAILIANVAMKAYAAAQVIASGATKVWTAIQAAFNFVMALNPVVLIIIAIVALIAIIVLIATKTTWFQTIWQKVWGFIGPFITGVFNGIKAFLVGVFNFLKTIFMVYFNVYKTIVMTVFNVIRTVITVAINVVKTVISAGVNAIKKIWEGIKVLWEKAKEVVGKVVGFFKELPGKVVKAIGNVKDKLLQVGKDIMSGLVNGIEAGIQWVKDKVAGLGNLIPGWLKSKLGINSPSKVMAQLGKYTMQGLRDGIAGQIPQLEHTLSGVESTITGLSASPSIDLRLNSAAALGAGSASGRTEVTINVNVPPTADRAAIGREVVKAVQAAQRESGIVWLAA